MGTVGIVGLGIMGTAYAANLIEGGMTVHGADPLPEAQARLEALGGTTHDAAGTWLADCDLVILALISPVVLKDVTTALTGFLNPGQVVLDTGTFTLADKMAAHATLDEARILLLDCPVSGTGAQAAEADIVMMVSGADNAIAHARPYLAHFTKKVIEAGAFGTSSRLKFVANHAVALHNTAAAETLSYADALGLDRAMVYDMLSSGAGQSKMSDLRMPLMINGNYDPPTASLKMFEKDLSVIGEDIKRLGLATPLFDECVTLYADASASLPETHDTASVFEVYRAKSRS